MDANQTSTAPSGVTTSPQATPPPAVNPVVPTPPQDSDNNKMIWWLLGGLIIIIFVIGGVYFFLSQNKASQPSVPVSTTKTEEDLEAELNSLDVDSTLEADFATVDQDLNAL